jgi:DNA polymerase I-like protein with 3'-5' exonuclease and polymerase domains
LLVIASGKLSKALDITQQEVRDFIRDMLYDPNMEVICHNAMYDITVLHYRGIIDANKITCKLRDTMVCQFLLDEEESKHLKEMVLRHLHHRMVTYEEATKSNDSAVEKIAIQSAIDNVTEIHNNFHKRRPWPGYDSTNLVTPANFKLRIKQAVDTKWPSEVNGEKVKYDAAARQEKKDFQTKNLARLELLFGQDAKDDYWRWAETTIINPGRARIAELDVKLDEIMKSYSEDDARQTLRLWNRLAKRIEKLGLTQWLRLECEVRRITVAMSVTGIPTNTDVYKELDKIAKPLMEEMWGELQNTVKQLNDDGEPFNPRSPKQLIQAVFGLLRCDVPVYKKLPNGQLLPKLTSEGEKYVQRNGIVLDLRNPATLTEDIRTKYLACDNEVLERISHPIGMMILNYRTVDKLHSTYVVEGLKGPANGRIKGLFDSIGTATGRLSSKEPNLQNIPSRKKGDNYDKRVQYLGPRLREAIAAEPGKSLIVVDQSQIELRIIADYCQERNMIAAYTEGVEVGGIKFYTGDIHAKTSKQLSIDRKLAKNINFGFNYGMGPEKFARQMRLFDKQGTYDVVRATDWRNGFFRTYPGILAYIDTLKNHWDEGTREFSMRSGRHRHFPEQFTTGGKILNAKVQGSSADIMKINMFMIDKYVRPICPSLELIFQVHDELGFQCNSGIESKKAAVLIKYIMEREWFPMAVPILSSAKVCQSWAAKDDDNIPEVGVFYARVEGVDMLFTEKNWSEYLAYEKQKKVEVKCAVAMLSPQHLDFCKKHIPERLPEL